MLKAVCIAATAICLLGLTTVDVSAAPSTKSHAHQAGPPGLLMASRHGKPSQVASRAMAAPASAVLSPAPVPSPALVLAPAPAPAPINVSFVPTAVPVPTLPPLPVIAAGVGGLGLPSGGPGVGIRGGVAVRLPVSPTAGGSSRPAHPGLPRDPERNPQPGLIVVQSFPVGLAVAFGGLPLLFAIWLVALVRFGAAARREYVGRGHLALAAELGIAPARLAGLDQEELALLRDKVAFDELTGIMRRAGGLATLDREISRARRRRTPLTVAFVDIDGLKIVNDSRGHAAGDAVLREVAGVLTGRLRAEDAIFRYGGDEFCCVLPDANLEAAGNILGAAGRGARERGLNFSVGLAELRDPDDRAGLLARADAELYRGRAARGHQSRK